MKIIVLLGAPGSGKGTVASRLVKEMSVNHVSSGDLLRAAVKTADTPAAKAAADAMAKGELVADEVVGALVIEKFKQCGDDFEYLFLDGYPRNEKQAASLEAELAKVGGSIYKAVWLEVAEEILIKRLSGRRVCPNCAAGYHVETLKPAKEGICDACGTELIARTDDAPDKVANRLKVYQEQTAALIGWYESRGILARVEAADELANVAARVSEAVK